MKFFSVIIIFLSLFANAESADNSCDCPTVKCNNPCEEQTGVTFYTEKCAQGKKVKSCAKPTCTELEEPTPACLAYKKNKGQNREIASTTQAKKDDPKYIPVSPKVGTVNLLKGSAWSKNEAGVQKDLSTGESLYESDMVITASNGRVRIKLTNGNIIHVLPNSIMKMTEVNIGEQKTLIDLYKGKVRSNVTDKIKGADNYYRIRTKSAVAGVRGTEFVVSYEINQKAVTKVQTIEGDVELASADLQKKQNVLGGQEASFVVAANSTDVFSEDEINDFIARGYMTPVYKMTEAEVKNLKFESDAANDMQIERKLASKTTKNKFICNQPKGKLNQCFWQCENNPKGEKRCRTDLPHVNCVRRLCNANGDWVDEMRLPATFFDKCDPNELKVGPCDY
ncbi:MAG: FecR domain-containing protein [Bdellovibrionales bacterium]|nr:FecR domain-containing protein [Bdellovibrionales bacterium]